MKKLTDICDIQYGYAFDSKCFTEDSSYPQLVRIRDVKKGYSETYYSGDYPEEYILSEGDLLVGMDGEFNIARWKCSGALLNQRVCRLTAKVGTNEEYLRFAMSKSLKEIEQRTAFVTVKHLSAKELNKLELDVPELSKQDKIADTLSRLERVIEARKEEMEKLDDLIKARFVEMFGDNDKKVAISSLCDVSGGYSFKSEDISSKGFIKILQIGNVYLDDVNWETTNYLPKGFDNVYSRFLLNEGDIVIALTRPIIQSLGNVKACIVKASDTPCLLNQRVGRIVSKKNVDVNLKFIYGCLMTDDFTRYVESCCIGCSQPNISTKDIENYMIPDASYEKQMDFVKFKEQVDKSKVAVQKALDETQLLFDSLMQQYFE